MNYFNTPPSKAVVGSTSVQVFLIAGRTEI